MAIDTHRAHREHDGSMVKTIRITGRDKIRVKVNDEKSDIICYFLPGELTLTWRVSLDPEDYGMREKCENCGEEVPYGTTHWGPDGWECGPDDDNRG